MEEFLAVPWFIFVSDTFQHYIFTSMVHCQDCEADRLQFQSPLLFIEHCLGSSCSSFHCLFLIYSLERIASWAQSYLLSGQVCEVTRSSHSPAQVNYVLISAIWLFCSWQPNVFRILVCAHLLRRTLQVWPRFPITHFFYVGNESLLHRYNIHTHDRCYHIIIYIYTTGVCPERCCFVQRKLCYLYNLWFAQRRFWSIQLSSFFACAIRFYLFIR